MIILASTSTTRNGMLRNAGLAFNAVAPQVDEKALVAAHPEWLPRQTAIQLAQAKALEVSFRYPDEFVIGADQVLAIGNKIFGKPADKSHCKKQLTELRGKSHSLISAVVLARGGKSLWAHADEARLMMRAFSDAFLDSYLETIGNDCTSSVGGYKIEGIGIQLFESIAGDYFTILGLPLLPLLDQLRNVGEISS